MELDISLAIEIQVLLIVTYVKYNPALLSLCCLHEMLKGVRACYGKVGIRSLRIIAL